MEKQKKKIFGIKKLIKIPDIYIGKFSKKGSMFGFVDEISDKEYDDNLENINFFYNVHKINGNSVKRLKESLHISFNNMQTALDGDIVLVTKLDNKKGLTKDGRIKNIVVRKIRHVVGTYQASKNFGFVVPDDEKFLSDIFISKKNTFGAHNGDKVIVDIIKYSKKNRLQKNNSEGKIVKIVARKDDSDMKLKSLLAEQSIDYDFNTEVLSYARSIDQTITNKDLENRKDLTDIYTITIDGEDAKDLDDAIAIEKTENFKVWISIADVANYVKENSILDKEAQKRGNSIYLIDTVIPMLPFELSNEICSLNANEKRLAVTVYAEIDKNGNIIDSDVYESVIKVDKRMSYHEVQDILDGKLEVENKNYFKLLDMLTKALIKRREKEGYINFNLDEIEVILDENGRTIGIGTREKIYANKIIEHLMLTANEVVAKKYENDLPLIYRIHETPDVEKVEELNENLKKFGIRLNHFKDEKTKEMYVPQREYQRVLKEIGELEEKGLNILKDTKEKIDIEQLSYLLLRSMKQARYDTKNTGHFGIGATHYLHFTSPIRRYADLYTHRILKEFLKGKGRGKTENNILIAQKIAEHISDTERIAQKLERDYDDIKISEYVEEFIGKLFYGTITGKIQKGIFVDIGKKVEGMIFSEKLKSELPISQRTEDVKYEVGQKILVRVISVNTKDGKIDLIEEKMDENIKMEDIQKI